MGILPTSQGRQGRVVHLSQNQHNVVLGTAGSGKSTMAVLRALYLSLPSTRNHGPVLLVTYNNTLVTYLEYLSKNLPANVTVQTYGRFARGYLHSMGLMNWQGIAQGDQVRSLIDSAVQAVRAEGGESAVLDRDHKWIEDEIHWISGMGFSTESEYQQAARVGRKTPLPAGTPRSIVWAVRQQYRTLRTAAGRDYDWYDIASAVRGAIVNDSREPMYRHIVIDEGQDLSPEAIRSLAEVVDPDGSVTFFGDYHQAIYGQGLSWRSSGLDLNGRQVEKFNDNYRNTRAIAEVAIAMADSGHMNSGDLDLVPPRAPKAAGGKPTLITAASRKAEIACIRELIEDAANDQSVAVLTHTRAEAEAVVRGFSYTSIAKNSLVWDGSPGIYAGTLYSAKGLEFDSVFLPFLDDDIFPRAEVLAAFGDSEACAREARLLYVGITRARSRLVMSHSGTVTRLLPENSGLWEVVAA
ncbi:3'-5' exonuclease [Demequina sp. SO4-13]|uniref:3'-5' exonuclease n=1 Tax=Demequina sp. SO4-13 TaxID=3401027 RepID=UPI003AF974B0